MLLLTLFIVYLVGAIALGVPIAFALLFCSVATGLHMGGTATNPTIIATQLMRGTDSVTMMALPFFVLAGELMNRGGLTTRIINFANIFVGRVRGGLGYVTILACLMFASLIGSAVASTAALGAILIPMMAKSGYDRAKAAGLVASANLVAPIMPPSVPFIVYGIAAGVSIKSLFLAGIAPAVYLTVVACVIWFIVSRKDAVKTDEPRPTLKEGFRIFVNGMWALLLPVIILVGLRGGVFTATEAGVVAVVYALFVGIVIYRELKVKEIFDSLIGGAKMSAVVMFLAATAQVAGYFMTISGLPKIVIALLEPLVHRPTLLMFVLMVIVLVVGLAMDVVPTILILTPILVPVLEAADISLVYFGVVFVLANVLGLTSPPVGPVLNVACATGNVKMDQLIPPVMPYFLAQSGLVLLLALVPSTIMVPLGWLGG